MSTPDGYPPRKEPPPYFTIAVISILLGITVFVGVCFWVFGMAFVLTDNTSRSLTGIEAAVVPVGVGSSVVLVAVGLVMFVKGMRS
jgi:hypothetical protein